MFLILIIVWEVEKVAFIFSKKVSEKTICNFSRPGALVTSTIQHVSDVQSFQGSVAFSISLISFQLCKIKKIL